MKYRRFFELAIDAIFILEDYRFIECNRMTLTMFGCDDTNDILGAHPWDFSPPHQQDGNPSKDKSIELIDATLSGTPQKFVWRSCKKNREEFCLLYTSDAADEYNPV